MKISLFMDKFPSFPETYVLWHIAELVRAGQDVTLYPAHADWQAARVQPEVEELGLLSRIVTPPGQPATSRGERVEEVAGALLRAAYRQPAALLKALPMSGEGGGMNMVQVLRHLGALPPMPDATVSHAYFAPPGRRAQMLRDAGALAGPLVVSFLGFDLNVLPNRVDASYYARIFAGAECLTVSSRYMRRRLLALGAPAERVRLLPLGLPLRKFASLTRALAPGQPLRLLSAARLVKIKGLEWGVRGVAQAVRRGLDVRWDIFGDGPLRAELEALAASEGVASRITFHGFQPMNVVRDAMALAHVGLFPGVRTSDGAEEALGGAVLEAQAAGLPVIASDAGGVMEGFDPGRTGLLVPQADADAIADAIAALLADPEQLTRMGQAGRAFIAERFDAEQLNTRWLHLYAELAAGRLPSQHALYPFDDAPGDTP